MFIYTISAVGWSLRVIKNFMIGTISLLAFFRCWLHNLFLSSLIQIITVTVFSIYIFIHYVNHFEENCINLYTQSRQVFDFLSALCIFKT